METPLPPVNRITAEDYKLPDEVFARDARCEVTIGDRVLRTVTSTLYSRIDIYDPSPYPGLPEDLQPDLLFGTAHFQAWVEDFAGKPMLRWSVKNWDPQATEPGVKHPGIHPDWLLTRSLEFLDDMIVDEGSEHIRYMQGEWMKPKPGKDYMSSNWEAYQAAKSNPAVTTLPSEEQQAAAAFLTPTGRMAAANHFGRVAQVSEYEDTVLVVFER